MARHNRAIIQMQIRSKLTGAFLQLDDSGPPLQTAIGVVAGYASITQLNAMEPAYKVIIMIMPAEGSKDIPLIQHRGEQPRIQVRAAYLLKLVPNRSTAD